MNWITGCFAKPDCAAAMSAAAMVALAFVGIVQAVVLIVTWLAILSSTRETSRLRQETAKQVRLSALPILEVIFGRGPDQILLRNVAAASAASAASRALLQGVRFSWNEETWRCTFEPTGLIAPGQETRLGMHIEREPVSPTDSESIPDLQVFTTVFARALRPAWRDMSLDLYFEDMLGNYYQSKVRIDFVDFEFFVSSEGRREMRPEIARTTLVGIFPGSPDPVDATIQST